MSDKEAAGGGCLALIILIIFNITIGGLATEYVFETWVTYFKEAPVDIPFWVAAIAGLFIAEVTVPAAIVTWLLTFAIVGL